MLNKFKYVLIIGAGGSKPYDFPLGLELYRNIRNNYVKQLKDYFKENHNRRFRDPDQVIFNAENFMREMQKTYGVSIDKYLNINNGFMNEGIRAIISEIYSAECKSKLPINGFEPDRDWYTYLFQKLTQSLNTADDMLRINNNKISFITFNYDRSLEHFLFENLYGLVKNAFISKKNLAEIFLKIPFIHIYGKIGHLPWQKGIYREDVPILDEKNKIVSYGMQNKKHPIDVSLGVQSMINIMFDERKEEEELNNARKLIKEADRVLFLGFGYDELNLEILDIPNLLVGKRVYGTAFEKTKNEIIHIKSLLGIKSNSKSEIYDFDCLTLIREHLV